MLSKLLVSITTTDSYILFWAIATGILYIITSIVSRDTSRRVAGWKLKRNTSHSKDKYATLSLLNTLLTTIISLFPLLGMFGTVRGLLMVDFSLDAMDGVQANFFNALTSTAWGIIFSILFKLLYAFISSRIEKLLEETNTVSKEKVPHSSHN